MSKDDIEAEYEREMNKIQQAKTNTEEQEDLKPQMEDFLKVKLGPILASLHIRHILYLCRC